MSYKSLHLTPLSTRGVNFKRLMKALRRSSCNYRTAEFFRSWVIYDSELDKPRRINRNALLGMALVVAISAGFWTVVAAAIARVWK